MSAKESSVLAWHQTRPGAQRLREMVAASPVARLLGLESSAEDMERKAISLRPDILLLELEGGINGTADMLQRLGRTLPRSAIVVLAGSREPEDILTAMRMGVREYLTEPVAPQTFNDAVLRLMRQPQMAGKPVGRITLLDGGKGRRGGHQPGRQPGLDPKPQGGRAGGLGGFGFGGR